MKRPTETTGEPEGIAVRHHPDAGRAVLGKWRLPTPTVDVVDGLLVVSVLLLGPEPDLAQQCLQIELIASGESLTPLGSGGSAGRGLVQHSALFASPAPSAERATRLQITEPTSGDTIRFELH